MYTFTGFGHTDVGIKRTNNEDFHLIEKDLGLFILCDGVGGHQAGEVASRTAAVEIQKYLLKHKATIEDYRSSPDNRKKKHLGDLLVSAIQSANDTVFSLAAKGTAHEGMTTTAEVLLMLPEVAMIGHVGDSRSYLIRGGVAHQLTEDHKYSAEMIRKGVWDAETAARSPFSNTLTRAVGHQKIVEVDLLEVELARDDLYLLCSDGFSDYFTTAELPPLLTGRKLEDLPASLVHRANARGGKDNITTIAIQVQARDATALPSLDVLKKQQALNKVPLFGYFAFAELCKVLALSTVRTLKSGDFLFRQGDKADDMFVVVSGTFEVMKDQQILATLRQGAPIGEMGILDNSPRSATVRAREEPTVLVINKTDIIHLLKHDPVIGVKFLWAMSQELDRRLRTTSRDLASALSTIEQSKKNELPFNLEKI